MKQLAGRVSYPAGKDAFAIWHKARELEAQGVDIIHLEIGVPDFPTPAHITETAYQAILAGRTTYGRTSGTPALRQAVADYFQRTRGIAAAADNVIVTAGVMGGMFNAVMALVDQGQDMLYPDPGFPIYQTMTAQAGGTSTPYPLRAKNNFQPDPEEIRAAIRPNTTTLLLNSPHNPTGAIIERAVLEEIAAIAIEHDLWVISDEVYAQLYFGDQAPPSIAQLPNMLERPILLDGLSKSYAMTGWRIGFGLFPPA
ncbi:MAG TPA: aminotransferase class I/II-fold pyridoxal phosphate-dependent enzyme, partial [Anaerolineae bacterium]|nr:aminotransferase class I/II-fold pyridoxal phosphate-dependent enzyme [Anaerolineae bacterium]